jgi:hypothetical protein
MMWYLCGGCNPVTTDEMLTTMAIPRRGFSAGLTGPTLPAFIDAACSSGAFGEFAR